MKGGEWVLNNISITDKKNNSTSVVNFNISAPGFQVMDLTPYTIQVTGGLEDTTPPELNSVTITPQEAQVTAGGKVKVSVNVVDEGSGINSVWANFVKPSGRSIPGAIGLSYNQTTGLYEGTYTVDQFDELGEWRLDYISTRDIASNSKTIRHSITTTTNGEIRDFSTYKFEVVGTTPDLLGPILDSLAISLGQVSNNSAVVKLTAESSDKLSGITSFYAYYKKPSGKSQTVYFSYNSTLGKYEGSIPIDRYDELGTWKLYQISMNDKKYNSKSIVDSLDTYYSTDKEDFSPFHFTVRGVITIPPTAPFSIGMSPKVITLEPGQSQQIKATLNMTDSTTRDITSQSSGTVYTSSNPSTVKVDANGLITIDPNAVPGVVYIQAANSGLYGEVEVKIAGEVSPKDSLRVSPMKVSLASGQSQQLNVVSLLANGTEREVTLGSNGTQYSSSDPTKVSVNENGLISVAADAKPGDVKVTINYNGIASEVAVTVTGPPVIKSLVMAPDGVSVINGETVQLNVRATMSDGTTKDVTEGTSGTVYTSSDESRATVDANGLIQILDKAKSGTVTIKAMNSSVTTQSVINVNGIPEVTGIQVTPASVKLKQGESQQLKIEASYSNGTVEDVTSQAAYKSSNSSLVIVDSTGVVTIPESSTGGTVNITVTFEGKTTVANVTIPFKPVLESLTFTPANLTLKPGESQQLGVQANYSDESTADVTSQVAYKSSDESLVTVDESGFITVNKEAQGGTVYIRGTYGGKGGVSTVSIPTYTPPTVIS